MKKFFEKIKKIKNIEIYLAVVTVVVIIAIYFSTLPEVKKVEDSSASAEQGILGESYADMIESKLKTVVKNIKNSGSVAVMVMTDGEGQSELAYNIEEKTVEQTGANGQAVKNTTTNKTPVLSGGQPVILWTNPPRILAVVVVASGAGDPGVRINIINAVKTVVGDAGLTVLN
jgi:stage III sporulation protein AG